MVPKQTLRKIKKLYDLYLNGIIEELDEHHVSPNLKKDSRENVLYFFLPCAINFQRSSPALWKSALNTWNDPKTNYVFFPEKVVAADYESFKSDMTKYRLAMQTNKHPKIWWDICTTLHGHYDNDPRNIFKEGNYEVKNIVNILQKEKKHLFPYLGGIKLSNYVLAIIDWFTDVEFKDIYNLSIIPDTHVIKSTVALGLAEEGVSSKKVEEIWRPIMKELELVPTDMHSALWHWSKRGFEPSLDGL